MIQFITCILRRGHSPSTNYSALNIIKKSHEGIDPGYTTKFYRNVIIGFGDVYEYKKGGETSTLL